AGLFAAATAALLGRLGCRPWAWALAVALFATSQRVAVMASSFSDADLAQAAALFAAFAFAVPRPPAGRDGDADGHREAAARGDIVDACWAGLLSGIALGIKVSAVIPALIVLTMSA